MGEETGDSLNPVFWVFMETSLYKHDSDEQFCRSVVGQRRCDQMRIDWGNPARPCVQILLGPFGVGKLF